MRHSDIGPGALWSDDDGPEYVGDEVLYTEAVRAAVDTLAGELEARAAVLREDTTLEDVIDEIKMQMATAAMQGHFGTARELNDMLLSLHMAHENMRKPF